MFPDLGMDWLKIEINELTRENVFNLFLPLSKAPSFFAVHHLALEPSLVKFRWIPSSSCPCPAAPGNGVRIFCNTRFTFSRRKWIFLLLACKGTECTHWSMATECAWWHHQPEIDVGSISLSLSLVPPCQGCILAKEQAQGENRLRWRIHRTKCWFASQLLEAIVSVAK